MWPFGYGVSFVGSLGGGKAEAFGEVHGDGSERCHRQYEEHSCGLAGRGGGGIQAGL